MSRSIAIFLIAAITQAGDKPGSHAAFRTTDGGRTWVRAGKGLPPTARINAFGAIAGNVLAGTDAGIFVSSDEGQSWQPTAVATPRTLTFAALEKRVYAGTAGNGILVSNDHGLRWTRIKTFPSKTIRALLAANGSLYAGTDSHGVYRSGDGQTWTPVAQGLPVPGQIFALAQVNGEIFAGTYAKGLYIWDILVQRWSKVGPVAPLVLAAAGNTLIVGHNPGGIFSSNDLGATWTQATGDLPDRAPVWEMGSNGTVIFAGASSGIYFSTDRGRSWTRSRTGLPSESPGIAFLVKGNYALAAAIVKDHLTAR